MHERFAQDEVDSDLLDSLQQALDKLGYEGLVDAVLSGLFELAWHGTVREMLPVVGEGLPLDTLLNRLSAMRRHATSDNPVVDLTAVGDEIRTQYEHDKDVEAKVNDWLTRSIYHLADAQTALDHAADKPGPDHMDLHAAALMQVGRVREAITILEQAVANPAADGAPAPESTVMLLAGAYEQAGAVDRALIVVEDLNRRRPGYFESLDALFVLAMLQTSNGQHADALNTLNRAAPFARTAAARAMVAASRALTAYDLGQRDDALDILMGIDPTDAERTDDYWWGFIRILARVWRNLIVAGAVSPQAHSDLLDRIDAELAALANGTSGVAADAAGQRAQLAEARGQAATQLYTEADAHRRTLGPSREPREVIEMARAAYEGGNAVGRAPLEEVAEAVAASIGELDDPLIAAIQLRPLSARLTELAGAVWDYVARGSNVAEQWETLLAVGELQRDTVHRIRSAASGAVSGSVRTLPDLSAAKLSRLARPTGTFAVVTWFQLGVGRDGTRFQHIAQPAGVIITPDGQVRLWLPMADDIPSGLQRTVGRVRSRLANWHDGRAGDPLDLSAWQEAAAWIRDFLAAVEVGQEPHVVFMEYPEMPGAPWHTAIGPNWTASYASSWSELLDIANRVPGPPGNTIGVVHVPRFHEPQAIRDALTASVEHTLERHGRDRIVHHRASQECDRDWLRRLLRDADIVKILCHGLVSPNENEVCLMLAHQGTLPMAGSLAADARGRQHRFSWRDCRDITDSHATIFSAACSSRAAVSTEAGDRLSIFAALRRSGARSLVAPAWDVQAGPTAALLDHTLDLYTSGTPLAHAVRSASDAAEAAGMRPWIARSLAVEGDWR
ncbi:CHAT domain-containing protein [Streptomyces sp. NPDC008092]|uniref:CHAT domain-containing protein n=1 Tax=Streptomyces sp. NPDC008092 TaxID=3364808 RepID=UPI0036E90D27